VTCFCNPEAVPDIPNLDVTLVRPDVRKVLEELVTPPPMAGDQCADEKDMVVANDTSSSEVPELSVDIEAIPRTPLSARPTNLKPPSTPTPSSTPSSEPTLPRISEKLPWHGFGGGIGVAVAGPDGMMREASQAVMMLRMGNGLKVGGVGFVGECYSV
jgi:ferric-chelate reductase